MKYATSPPPSRASSMLGFNSRTQSPLPHPVNYRSGCVSATSKTYKYLRRLLKFKQMDFEFALWQMLYLFISPQKVYRNVNYRKQTKSQFARDDPAFIILLIISLCVTSIGFAWVLNLSFSQIVIFLLYVVFIDFIFAGMISASIFWVVANKYLTTSSTDGDIEWGYSFDVHVNAFFPPLIILHFIQLFFYKWLISQEWFFSRFLGNTLWLLGLGYYIYITFLGYNCIPHLKNTKLILVALPIIFICYVVSLTMSWNFCVTLMNYYHYRVL